MKMKAVPRPLFRQVCLYLADRVEKSFPQDWAPDVTFQDVVRRWLLAEANRR